MKKYILMLSILISSISVFAQGIQFEHGTWSEVLAKAKKENKLVFVDVYTTWCGPCKMMSNEIFPLKSVGEYFNTSFINYKIDAEKGEGVTVADKYQVQSYPTYLYVNGDGELIFRSVGSMPAEQFIEEGKKAFEAKNFKSLSYYQEQYEANKNDTTFLSEYIYKLKSVDMSTSDVVQQYVTLLPADKQVSLTSFEMIKSGAGRANTNHPLIQFYVQNKEKFDLLSADIKNSGQRLLKNAAYYSLVSAAKAKDENKLNELIAFNKKYLEGSSADFYYENYYKFTKNNDKYFEFAQKRMDKIIADGKPALEAQSKKFMDENIQGIKASCKDDAVAQSRIEEFKANYGNYIQQSTAGDLNAVAWNILVAYSTEKDKSKLEKAEIWSKFSNELSQNSPSLMDTHACILYCLGKKSEAIKLEQNALALAIKMKESGVIQDFTSKIAIMKSNKTLDLKD